MSEEIVKSCDSPLIESESAQPNKAKWLNVVLLAAGLAGWMIFVVACVGGPAWSPDGSKILFGYYDEANSRNVVAVYDLKKHKSRDLFEELIPQSDKDQEVAILAPAWQADGARALVAMNTGPQGGDLHCVIESIPLKAGDAVRAYNFGKDVLCYTMAWTPQINGLLYLGSEGGLTWLNLATGKIDSQAFDNGMGFLSEHNGQLVYMREVERPAPTSEDKEAKEIGVEFGQIELKELIRKPFFSVWGKDMEGIADNPGGSWEPNGTRIAMVGNGSDGGRIILLDEKKGLLNEFTPDLGGKPNRIGPPVWSHDGKTLYAPVIIDGNKDKPYIYSMAEMAVAGTSARLTHIADFHEESMKDDEEQNMLDLGLQVSLSPDGKTIAASTATLRGAVAAEDRGLYLIDVAHAEHRITKVTVPKSVKKH